MPDDKPLADKQLPDTGLGVHIRAQVRNDAQHPQFALLTVDIWPVPLEVLEELHKVMQAAAMKLLVERNVVEPLLLDLKSVGESGLPN